MTINLTDKKKFIKPNEILSVSINQDKFNLSMCVIAFRLERRSEHVHSFLFVFFFLFSLE